MIDGRRAAQDADADFVAFRTAGEAATGEFRCADCGYGVAVSAGLPTCPMCGGTVWEPALSSPFGRAGELL